MHRKAAEACLAGLEPDACDCFLECLGGKPIKVVTRPSAIQEIDFCDALKFINPSELSSKLLLLLPGDSRQILYMFSQLFKQRLAGRDRYQSEEWRWLDAFAKALIGDGSRHTRTLESLLLEKSAEEYIHSLLGERR